MAYELQDAGSFKSDVPGFNVRIMEGENWDGQKGFGYVDASGYVTGMWATIEEAIAQGNTALVREHQPEEPRVAPKRVAAKMVLCDCGHAVAAILVMTTSRGTSCPDCYDEMSD